MSLLKVPRWRRSKLSTAMSCVTPSSAALVTLGEIPAARASVSMLATKVWKSPPHRAANEGVEISSVARTDAVERARRTLFMTNHFLPGGKQAKAVAPSVLLVLPQTENGELSPAIDGSQGDTDPTITCAAASRSNALIFGELSQRRRPRSWRRQPGPNRSSCRGARDARLEACGPPILRRRAVRGSS